MLLKEIEHLYEEYGDEPEKIILSGPISHNQIVCDKVKTVALYFHSIGKGGVQRVLSLLIPIYMELGYKVVLITEEEARCSDYEVSEKVKRYVIPKEGQVVSGQIKYLERAEKIAKILKAENVDVFCHHNAMSSLLFYDMLAVKNAGVWFILVKHQVFSCELLKGKNYYKKYKKIFNYMDEVIVLSEIEAEYWKKLGISSKYIPNPANPQIKKNENGSEEYILWEGRLDKTPKNYLDAVEIMNCVVKKVPNAIMKIYGSGSLADERELLSAIKKNSLQKNVFYCGYTTLRITLLHIYIVDILQILMKYFAMHQFSWSHQITKRFQWAYLKGKCMVCLL